MKQFITIILILVMCGLAFSQTDPLRFPQQVPIYKPYPASSGAVEQFKLLANRDFTGGLNVRAFKTNVKPNEAIVLENALWTRQGELVKRRGYSIHSTTPEVFNFEWPYYQQDGNKYLMGGSDTALYFWHEDSASWTYLIGTEGTSGRWDGTTFNDKFVGAHAGIEPFMWDGSEITELGVTSDSFSIWGRAGILLPNQEDYCHRDSFRFINGSGNAPYGSTDEWVAYMVGYDATYRYGDYWSPDSSVVTFRKDICVGNTADTLTFTPGYQQLQGIASGSDYFKMYSWFGEDTVWRTGKVDIALPCTTLDGAYHRACYTKIIDTTFYWDSTFSYDDYVFVVTTGTGENKYTFLGNYLSAGYDPVTADTIANGAWDTTGFFVYSFYPACFDTTTEYKIYKPKFTVAGQFVESFDARLWIAGDPDTKNRLIFSKVGDAGIFAPENNFWIGGDDGDWITGMATFYSNEGGYRATPVEELIVSKNNSMIKVVPTNEVDPYMTTRLTSGVGCLSNWTMSSAEGRLMIFADQTGVYGYDGQKVQKLSLKIDPLLADWDYANGEYFSGIYNPEDRHYYLSYSEKTSSTVPYCIVSWEDDRSAVADWDVYAQLLDYNMDKIDTNFMISDTGAVADSNQSASDVGIDPQQNWVFVWNDERTGEGTGSIRIRRFDVEGNALDSSYLVSDDGTYNRGMPHIDISSEGKIVVVWEDRRNAQYTPDIYGQRYDSSLTKIGSNFLIDTVTTPCYEPHVQIADNGNFVVSWLTPTDPKDNIYFQRYDSTGTKIGNNVPVCDSVGASLKIGTYCEVGMEKDDGDFVLTWGQTTNFPTDPWRIWAELRDSAGTAKDSDFVVSLVTGETAERPSISAQENGSFVICWDDYRGSYASPICRRFDANGDTLGSEIWVTTDTSGEPQIEYTQVDMDNNGIFAVAWTDFSDPDDSTNAFVRSYPWSEDPRSAILQLTDRRVSGQQTEETAIAINRYFGDVAINNATVAWSYDFGGWSQESFNASAYCYQYGIADDVKILFADPSAGYVYEYGTQADDISTGVVLTYQTPYMDFGTYPNYDKWVSFGAIEGNGTGDVTLTWYKDFSDSVYANTVSFSGDSREQEQLTEDVMGKSISMKLITEPAVDDFLLSGYWWKYRILTERR